MAARFVNCYSVFHLLMLFFLLINVSCLYIQLGLGKSCHVLAVCSVCGCCICQYFPLVLRAWCGWIWLYQFLSFLIYFELYHGCTKKHPIHELYHGCTKKHPIHKGKKIRISNALARSYGSNYMCFVWMHKLPSIGLIRIRFSKLSEWAQWSKRNKTAF